MGYTVGGAVRGFVNGIVVCILGWILTGFTIDNILLTLILLMVVSWTFSAFGCIVGIFATSWDHIAMFTNFVFMPLTFLGGIFYSIDMLPDVWRTVSQINPLYWMINGLRYSTLGIYDTSPVISILVSIFFAVLFTFVSAIMFSKGYKIKE